MSAPAPRASGAAGRERAIVAGLAALAILLTAGIFATVAPYRPGPPPEESGVLSAAEVLAAPAGHYQLVDARPPAVFTAGRIAGAVSVHPDRLMDPALNALLPPSEVAAAFRSAGLSPDRPVVVYADRLPEAAYVGWVLVALGHRGVYILDGGFEAWRARGGPAESGAPPSPNESPAAGWPLASAESWPVSVHMDVIDLYDRVRDPGLHPVGTRPFAGRTAEIAAEGSSLHLPWHYLVSEDERSFLNPRALQRLSEGVHGRRQLVVYGGDPGESAVVWWALYTQGFTRITH